MRPKDHIINNKLNISTDNHFNDVYAIINILFFVVFCLKNLLKALSKIFSKILYKIDAKLLLVFLKINIFKALLIAF